MSLAALREPTAAPPSPVPAPPDSAPFLRKAGIPHGVTLGRDGSLGNDRPRVLPLHLGTLDEVLPDGGLPRGAVVEIAAPYGLARATSIALAACAAAQAEAKLRAGEGTAGAWCAWIEATAGGEAAPTLFAPAAARAGVDLARLLVVRPSFEALARTAARVADSRVFSVIVIDLTGVPGKRVDARLDRWVNPVRRLAIAAADVEATVVLLTDSLAPRPLPLPVALRLEVERSAADRISVTVAKDRRGRVGQAKTVLLPREPGAAPEPAAALPALGLAKVRTAGARGR
jgi:recombination protein RecA